MIVLRYKWLKKTVLTHPDPSGRLGPRQHADQRVVDAFKDGRKTPLLF
jgi:hypothetical protein